MAHVCSICNKTYINKYSLASHKSRYHKSDRTKVNLASSGKRKDDIVKPRPAFEYDRNKYSHIGKRTGKR